MFLEGNGNAFKEIAGHLQKMLKTLDKEQCGKWLNLVFAAQVFDAAGAQGQRFMCGARTFSDDFYRAYNLMHEMMHQLFDQSPDRVLQTYLSQRAAWMDLDQNSFIEKEGFDVIFKYIEQKRSGAQLTVENREQNNTSSILG